MRLQFSRSKGLAQRGLGRGGRWTQSLAVEVARWPGAQESTGQAASVLGSGTAVHSGIPVPSGPRLRVPGEGLAQGQQGAPHKHPGFREDLGWRESSNLGLRPERRKKSPQLGTRGDPTCPPQTPAPGGLIGPGAWRQPPRQQAPRPGLALGQLAFFGTSQVILMLSSLAPPPISSSPVGSRVPCGR